MYDLRSPTSSSPGTSSTRRPATVTNYRFQPQRPRCPPSPRANSRPTSPCPSTLGSAHAMTSRKSTQTPVFRPNPAGFTAPTPAAAATDAPGSALSFNLNPNKEETKPDAPLQPQPQTSQWPRQRLSARRRSRCPARLKQQLPPPTKPNNDYYKVSTLKQTPASSTTLRSPSSEPTTRSRVPSSDRLRSPSPSKDHGPRFRSQLQRHAPPQHQAPRAKIRGGEPHNR